MFTGIIQALSPIVDSSERGDLVVLEISTPEAWKLKIGQSISVNGVCLSVVKIKKQSFLVEMMPETINRTSFGSRMPEEVNLERSMGTDSLFEGHVVQGHVDCVATVTDVKVGQETATVSFSYPKKFDDLVVSKGSIAVDGVSLTVVEPQSGTFSVGLIPHTLAVTSLKDFKIGDSVNLEFDLIGKYINKQMRRRDG